MNPENVRDDEAAPPLQTARKFGNDLVQQTRWCYRRLIM